MDSNTEQEIERIQKIVSDIYKLDTTNRTRESNTVLARQIIWKVVFDKYRNVVKQSELEEKFGYSRANIQHGIDRVDDLIFMDKQFRKLFNWIISEIDEKTEKQNFDIALHLSKIKLSHARNDMKNARLETIELLRNLEEL